MQNNDHFKFYTGYKNVLGQKCSFFPWEFSKWKDIKPCYQTVLQMEYISDSVHWKYNLQM